MTRAMVVSQLSGYGAWELKRYYQQHLLIGITIAALVHVLVLGAIMIYRMLSISVEPVIVGPIDFGETVLEPPPSVESRNPLVTTGASPAVPVIGIPMPVADDEIVGEVRFATKQELADLSPSGTLSPETVSGGPMHSVVVDPSEMLPEPGQFVAFQEPPVCVHREPAIYPEIAQLTGREGIVIVYALVNKEGKVEKVKLAKASGMNVGFDEAALEAVSKFRFKPAIQNGRPAAVWVSQKIEFRMH